MKKLSTRLLAMLLCVLMCVSLLPAAALAADVPETVRENSAADNALVTNGKPKITTQPKSQSVMQGKTITLKVAATGGSLKYQWYYRKSASGSWTKMSGKTSASLKLTVGRYNGYQYRCKVSNKYGTVTSKAATLKVNYVKYRALLIGQTYKTTSATTLVGDVDVSYMNSALTDSSVKGPKGGKWEVTPLVDKSRDQIQSAITSTFAKADSNDVSLFYFSGHGDPESTGAYAGAICSVEGSSIGFIQLSELAGWLKKIPGKVVVFIDSCGSGAAIHKNGTVTDNAAANAAADRFNQAVINAFAAVDETIIDGTVSNTGEFRTSKFYVLTASDYQEESLAGDVSLFTYYAAYGLFGYADMTKYGGNGNNYVTLYEMYRFIKKFEVDDSGTHLQHVQMYPAKSEYKLTKVS